MRGSHTIKWKYYLLTVNSRVCLGTLYNSIKMTVLDSVKPPTDAGTFTVQSYDIPLGARVRNKSRPFSFAKTEVRKRKKKARLTPINEYEEIDKDDFDTKSVLSFDSLKVNEDIMIDRNDDFNDGYGNSLCGQELERTIVRSDTPVNSPKPKKKLSRREKQFDEELQMISEQPDDDKDFDLRKIMSDLPPRPKARLKILPPGLTSNTTGQKKRMRIRKLRHKVDEVGGSAYKSSLVTNSFCSFSTKDAALKSQPTSLLTRPQSADSGVRIMQSATLPKIQKSKSTSVPDLPSIMNKLAKARLKSGFKSAYEDNGALGTPRGAVSDRRNTTSLRGSDITSFYNMWEKANTSRVIGRQSPEKTNTPSPTFQRPCALMHKHDTRKHITREHFLPPIQNTKLY